MEGKKKLKSEINDYKTTESLRHSRARRLRGITNRGDREMKLQHISRQGKHMHNKKKIMLPQ